MNFEISNNINSLKEFDKLFNKNLQNVGKSLDEASSFNEVFNSINGDFNSKEPMKLSGSVQMALGADAINAQKIENISDTARMAHDIGKSFANGLSDLNAAQKGAEEALETFAAGGDISVHELMIATEKSSLAMQMAIQLRNQMVNAYTEFKNLRF